jgi:hypothetical protein
MAYGSDHAVLEHDPQFRRRTSDLASDKRMSRYDQGDWSDRCGGRDRCSCARVASSPGSRPMNHPNRFGKKGPPPGVPADHPKGVSGLPRKISCGPLLRFCAFEIRSNAGPNEVRFIEPNASSKRPYPRFWSTCFAGRTRPGSGHGWSFRSRRYVGAASQRYGASSAMFLAISRSQRSPFARRRSLS